MPKGGDPHNKELRVLEAVVDFTASYQPASAGELDDALREEGIDPEAAVDRMLQKYAKRTWRLGPPKRSPVHPHPPRPQGLTRAMLQHRLEATGASALFRNASSLSDEDLWDLLCDIEERARVDDE